MKNQITLVLVCLFFYVANAQDMAIETKSVSIENVISYVIETMGKNSEQDSLSSKNITFLIQSAPNGLAIEDKVILKQTFKLISKRLSEDDSITIISYSGINGVVLEKTSPKALKKIMHALENYKSSIKELHSDGIQLAYTYAQENFEEDTSSTVVIIRNPKASSASYIQNAEAPKKKSNTILITAIGLLPEIISLIKD
ncbi:hypothetical protein ES692_10065 [Psychroserpens burtonensis]|uniref:VWA domain-containing protein n=1 Tax=Psychroserpens burtonensis TaxID=49278 RepID=A0A5C7B9M2_9FLAO|nr:hypothetical protein [Psychroserpens burtonensis]TXE17320.1 hypothetical protein ES692_10065 [Psychroserpens burtonensis]